MKYQRHPRQFALSMYALLAAASAVACSSDSGGTSSSSSTDSGTGGSSASGSSTATGSGGIGTGGSSSSGMGGSAGNGSSSSSNGGSGGAGAASGSGGAGAASGSGGTGSVSSSGSSATGGGNACQAAPDSTPCDDGNACTQTDTCVGGTCIGKDTVNCASSDSCNSPSCDPATGACVNSFAPNGTTCDDGDACTLGDNCFLGGCVAAGQVTCSALDACHSVGLCDPMTGACSSPPAPDGAPCNDNLPKTTVDVCQGGTCTGYGTIQVIITSPLKGTVAPSNSVIVTGTVDQAGATVKVGNTTAVVTNNSFTATVPVDEGTNVLMAEAKAGGSIGSASTVVIRDTIPPRITITSPANNALLQAGTATVTGTIQDQLIGTVDASDCTVSVNGIQAEIANRGFRAVNVPILEGTGTITAIATDRAGNKAAIVLDITGDMAPNARIAALSGSGQSADVETTLDQPFTARVVDNTGSPVAGMPVTFQVSRGNGILANGERTVTVTSDAMGQASTTLTLGKRAGVATDQVIATAEGFLGTATFVADGKTDVLGPRLLEAVSGTNQRAVVSSLAPQPLVVVLTDEHGNPVAGEDVIFLTKEGGGLVDNAKSKTIKTDSDGRAFVPFTLGPAEGPGAQLVEVTSGVADPVLFVASGVVAVAGATTTVSGVVMTNEDAPITNVLVTIDGTPLSAVTDAEGRFAIANAPVGHLHLDVDGTTGGPYPPLTFEIDTISGVDNTMDRPIYMPVVDNDGLAMANPVTDVTLRRADTPGLELVVPAGSATFAGMGKTGNLQVIRVHRDKIPMIPPDGTVPTLALAIMPADVKFDPPAPIRFPNVDGRAPGELVTIYSFDHDLYEFVAIGTARVSEDGMEVISEPGQGIVKGGWHLMPPTPTATMCTTVANNCRIKYCIGNTVADPKCGWFNQGGTAGIPVVRGPAPVGGVGAPGGDPDAALQSNPNMPDWAPDGDCYNNQVNCQANSTCFPLILREGRPCVRQFNGINGDPLVGLTGTCIRPKIGAALDPNLVCCPSARICNVNCGGVPGNIVCCANGANAAHTNCL